MSDKTYVVKENDNLYDIANQFNTSIGIIKALNNLESNILQIGQILKIPIASVEISNPSDYVIYTIKKGDTLYNIAKTYNISLDELINFNEQDTTLLNIGEQLLIPKKNNIENISYVVKPGDTLYNLAKRYNISLENLKQANGLTNNLLKIGETIVIPNTKSYQTYVVRTNDTLENIAYKFNTDIENIKRINNLTTNDLTIGQILLIP